MKGTRMELVPYREVILRPYSSLAPLKIMWTLSNHMCVVWCFSGPGSGSSPKIQVLRTKIYVQRY
jgi:hypothetical protein